MKTKRQFAAIDIAKYVSALLVLAIHTDPFANISELFNTFFIQTLCRLAVPFFFTASAFFFFLKYRKQNLDDPAYFKSYLWRVVRLYLVWTVIYIPYVIWNYSQAGFSWYSIIAWFRDFLLNGSYYHLWFLPALILGMSIVYYGIRKLNPAIMSLIALILYVLGYLINVYAPIWESIPYVSIAYGFFTKTLVTSRDGLFFAPVYLMTGYWLTQGLRMNRKVSAIGLSVSFVGLILEVTIYYLLGILQPLSSMFLMLVPATYFLVSWLLGLRIPYKPQYKILRMDSTVIYTSQILFARIFLMVLPNATLAVYFLTLACCQALSAFIVRFAPRFPVLKYLV